MTIHTQQLTYAVCRVVAVWLLLGGAVAHPGTSWAVTAPAETLSGAIQSMDKQSLIVTPRYYIGPEDVLEIIVWRNADLSKVVTVRPDGRISLPLIGDVQAGGLTPSELTSDIAVRLQEYMQTPNVSVIIKEVKSYSIYVMGQVKNPGRYFLMSKTTLLQAITLAGGFTPAADRTRITIFRVNGTNAEIKLKASYHDILFKDHSHQNVIMKPGDTIVVPSETMVMMY
jgi:polysaccharide export outer membrane protein